MMTKIGIGNALHRIRLNRNLTQEEFADVLNISQSAYGRIETNQVYVKIEKVCEIADKLDIDVVLLLNDTFDFLRTKSKFSIVIEK